MENKRKLIASWKAKYGRLGSIWLTTHICHKCTKTTVVMAVDSSQDEYGPGYICKNCIINAFEEYK
ncbi:MAG: hypothetical protein ACXACY_26310 [Candidatus Hodarchaeales archaeon]|jgi:hypothetical protein